MIETDQKMDVFLNGKMMDGLAVDSHIYTGTLSLRERRERRTEGKMIETDQKKGK